MSDERFIIHDPAGEEVLVTLRRDKRLKKSARWVSEADGSILLRVPQRTSKANVKLLLRDIEEQLGKQQRRAKRRTDADLQERAEYINRTCFDGQIQWTAIRWVDNMTTRLGSCTTGGPTDGHIRISDKIQAWPQWVIDYVIAHELAHRVHSNHSPAFWTFLTAAYPQTDRARGFIDGVGFSRGVSYEEDA